MSMTAAIERALPPSTPALALPPQANENATIRLAAPENPVTEPAADATEMVAAAAITETSSATETTAAAPAASEPPVARRARKRLFRLERSEGWTLASIAAISFSLTFVAGGIALLTGLVPSSVASLQPPVDLGVLMLMVPVSALVLAMLAEVARAAFTGLPRIAPQRLTPALSDWRPRSR